MAVGGGGVSGLFWNAPVTAGHIAIWGSPGVLEDGGAPSAGSVTSVGLSLPVSIFSVSGSPVTTTGTLTGSLQTQTANTVFAGPTSGGAAAPTFRAIVTADLPDAIAAAGPIGSATVASIITFDAKGRLTTVTSATITPAVGSITGLGTGVATALGNTAGASGGFALFSALPTGANPTATIGTAAVNGSALTFMRSDGAPAFGNLTGPITSTGMATAIASQTGTGTKFVVDNTPTLITPVLGVATATSVTIGGATIGSDVIAWTGTATGSGTLTTGGVNVTSAIIPANGMYLGGANNPSFSANSIKIFSVISTGLLGQSTTGYQLVNVGSTAVNPTLVPNRGDTTTGIGGVSGNLSIVVGSVERAQFNSTAIQFGGTNATSPVAQIIKFQDGSGTNIAAAATATILGPAGTGTGTNGDIVFKTGVKTTTGSTAATQTTALTIKGETQRVLAATTINTGSYTVATLPTGVQGDRAYVTDALGPTFLVALVGGGTVKTPAFYDGTNWVGA